MTINNVQTERKGNGRLKPVKLNIARPHTLTQQRKEVKKRLQR